MRKKTYKTYKFFSLILLVALILNIGFIAWASAGQLTNAKLKIYKNIWYPLVLVNGRIISTQDFILEYQLALINYGNNGFKDSSQSLAKKTMDSLISDETDNYLAEKRGILINESRIDGEFANIPDSAEFLKQNNVSESLFKSQILRPYLTSIGLKIWYNQQKDLNASAYANLENLNAKLAAGSNFEDLSKFSADLASKETFGDLGFVESARLLPEILESLDNMKYNESRIIASRTGLHLIQLVEKDNNGQNNSARYHIRQIFTPTAGFEDWSAKETKKINIFKIIKIS